MKTIDKNVTDEYIINKSCFITNLIKVQDIQDVKKNIEEIKIKYSDATHNCYAYIVDNYKKVSDDNEPSGTAGIPILNVLENNELTNILCIVTRYFGGIKLGAGGLVRAYTNSVTKALEKSLIRDMIKKIKIIIEFKYDDTKNIDYLLKDSEITYKKFDVNVEYECLINYENYLEIKDKLNSISIKLIENEIINI